MQWQQRWKAARWFICADGEADKAWGNETIRWHPDEHWLELKLPAPLSPLANRPHGRYRLSCPVGFSHRGDEVAAQAASGAVRYDVTNDTDRGRWFLDASWKLPTATPVTIVELRSNGVLAVDVNTGHLAAMTIDASGNPVGRPLTITLQTAGLSTTARDGHLRAAISQLLATAKGGATKPLPLRTSTSPGHGPRAESTQPGDPPGAGGAGGSGAWWPGSPRHGSGTVWCRWRPTRHCR
ncbi:MAG: transposase, OrfB family [Actinobacteria bacterium]|nr:transposase, OrfB family [Actinomycetota bacterium]